MDYNTQREKLIMPEYGRAVQQMVEHCKGIEDRDERNRCARTIVKIMGRMVERTTDKDDFQHKLWNHLAAMAEYDIDIDYPVEIERMDDEEARPDRIAYPQQKIAVRNYGAIVEAFAKHIRETEGEAHLDELTLLLANHMKRDLSNWAIDSMSDDRVVDDLAHYTDGRAQIDLHNTRLVSDGELLSSRVSTTVKKKKKNK